MTPTIISNMNCSGLTPITDFEICKGFNERENKCCLSFCNTSSTNVIDIFFQLDCEPTQTFELLPGQCQSWFATSCVNSNVGIKIIDKTLEVTCNSSFFLNCL